jgi:hypothetical protein
MREVDHRGRRTGNLFRDVDRPLPRRLDVLA